MLGDLRGKTVLLLQGPMGPFFHRFARELTNAGARVLKLNLNAGDWIFYPGSDAHAYRGTLEEWPVFVSGFIKSHNIHAVFLFGDQRAYHRPIREITTELGARLYVFEEGYLRPNYITLESGGVNGRSSMPCNAESFAEMPSKPLKETKYRLSAYYFSVLYACIYHTAMSLTRWWFPHYQHHRRINAIYQSVCWLRGAFRYFWFRLRERNVLKQLEADSGRLFLVPLQVKDDAQVQVWSDFNSIEQFIEEIVASFAQSANPDDKLVLKHHPMDRAYSDYGRLVERLRAETDLGERLIYVHDVPMPKLLERAKGVVCINSTSGISALHHRVPVRTLGKAIYNIEGLVSRAPLSRFWQTPGKVDRKLFIRFRNWLLLHNQLQGSFYRRLPGMQTPTGLVWNPVELPLPIPQTTTEVAEEIPQEEAALSS